MRSGLVALVGLIGAPAVSVLLIMAVTADGDQSRPRAWKLDSIPALTLVEVQRIGSLDDPDHGFTSVGAISVDRDGNLFALELSTSEVRVYSPSGEFLRRFGGRGEGPGELSRAWGPFGVAGDTVWVYDPMHRRLTTFSRSGEVLAARQITGVSVQVHSASQTRELWPLFVDSRGLFVSDLGRTQGLPGIDPLEAVWVPRVRFDSNGQVVDTIGGYWWPKTRPMMRSVRVRSRPYPVPEPPTFDPVIVPTASGVIRVDLVADGGGNVFRVHRVSHAGDTLRSTSFLYEPRPFPSALLDEVAGRAARRVGPSIVRTPSGADLVEYRASDSAAARVAIRRELSYPDFQPPVRSHFLTATDGLWLEREYADAGFEQWLVLDSEDNPVGKLRLPSNVRIGFVKADTLWTIERDGFDVPWVVRYQIRVD